MPTTNLDQGITNNMPQNILGYSKTVDPTVYHEYFDDFDTYIAGNWVVTETQAGATETLANEDGGALLLTNTAADNDLVALQKIGESFLFEAGKPLVFKARFKVSDAIQSDLVIGLQITDTTPLAVTDGVYFQKDDGDANLDFHVVKNSTVTSATAITTLSNNTYITIGFRYDGSSMIEYFAGTDSRNPTRLGKADIANLPNDEELTVSFALQNGEAVAKTMSIDYILAQKER
ncbi:MAG: hypothetical protein ULS35scaffold63_19 [Phage 33_17]|nr:MAG: hypothetical protein ULS35scaffold63_19 [Phage 33_17]